MIRYDERFRTRRITKLRTNEQSTDKESIYFTPDSECEEEIIKFSFLLGDVETWEEENDPLGRFKSSLKKTMVSLTSNEYIILEDFEVFDKIMNSFILMQQEDKKEIYGIKERT